MKGLPVETDFVVVGAGFAGLRAAIELAEAGRVLLLSKAGIPNFKATDPKSEAVWLNDEDEVILHLQDTLDAGDGLSDPVAARMLVDEGAERIGELLGWARHGGMKLSFEAENSHTRSRVLHAAGESTAREVLRILFEKVQSLKHTSIAQYTSATELLCDAGRVTGVSLLDEKGAPHEIACSAVLLASGGMGQVYRNTNSPETATGDGIALAVRAGAEASDLEFVQFHPTALYMKKVPRFLFPESLREAGCLRNFEMSRFMGKYHPMGERASRDLVTRAIVHEMEVSRAKDPFVYLDLTHINPAKLQKLYPVVYSVCMAHNLDITEDMIPVRPAASFAVGGVRTDLEGRTSVPGLYAAGEVAATGVHGANRLPSNSLLESLVYGARAGQAMRQVEKVAPRDPTRPHAAYSNGPVDAALEALITSIQDVMWNEVGIVRTRVGMQKAVKTLEEMAPKLSDPKSRRAHEARNLHLTALLTARSALAREESRGAHYRMDFPAHDDKKFLKHSIAKGDKVTFV